MEGRWERWPLVRGGGGDEGRFGGEVGKGRVRRRSAREYWWVMKYVCASQNASFGSSKEEKTSGKWVRGKTTMPTGPTDNLVAPECRCLV